MTAVETLGLNILYGRAQWPPTQLAMSYLIWTLGSFSWFDARHFGVERTRNTRPVKTNSYKLYVIRYYCRTYGHSHRSHKKLNFLGHLCNLPCLYMDMAKRVFNIRLTHSQHLDNGSLIPDINWILTKYALHHVLDMYLLDRVFPCVHGNDWFIKRLSNEVTLNFSVNASRAILLALHWYCVLMVWVVYGPWTGIARNGRIFAKGQWG